jgi:Tol biopolymer transport system component
MFKSISKLLAFALAAALALAFPLVSLAASNDTVRVSVASDGTQGDRWSEYPSISADGRFVAFTSQASTLVAGDTNSMNDIFVYDSLSRTTTRVSVASDGAEGYFGAYAASISGDGRYVAFTSSATNLVAGDTNGASDVFLHDTQTGETTRVSLASDGSQGYGWSEVPSISTDGRYIAFYSAATNLVANDTNGASDVFLHDTQTGTTSRISVASGGTQGNDWSYYASISGDGRYVAYKSLASNLVAGDTNGVGDVFMYDTQSAETTRVSVASDGSQADKVSGVSSVSADGRYVAFESDATNLVIGDANGLNDIFLRDIQTGTTSLVSVSSDGTQGNSSAFTPSISGDGRFVLFATDATNLVAGDSNWSHDIFMHDTRSGKTIRVSLASDGSQGNNNSYAPSVSINGRFIAFTSTSSNLVDGDTNGMSDVYLHEVQVDPILRVSLATDGTQGNDWSYAPSISADGRSVAFESDATNLVAGDTNGVSDIFLHDTHNDETTRISLASDGTQGNDWSYAPSISADGRYVAFQSAASNLVADDTNGVSDIFLHDTQSGATTRV